MAEPHPARYDRRSDLGSLADSRALAILPVVLVCLLLPIAARLTYPLWEGASEIAKYRLLARVAGLFVLAGCYPIILIIIRLGITGTTVSQHRMLLTLYPSFTMTWQVLSAIDGVCLVAWPERFALPSFAADVGVSFACVLAFPFLLHHQSWWIGFDPRPLLEAKGALGDAGATTPLRTPLDTLDYRVLQLVAASGSDVARIMVNDMGIGARDLGLRLQKLCALGYLNIISERHGPQLTLTTLATDTLALPVSLFTWQTRDAELLHELASARLALEDRQAQKVVVACARCCERMLRGLLSRVEPPVRQVNGKEVSKATLGELVGACRQWKLIGRFEDNIFSALNERRKKIHALTDEKPIDDHDAFVLYTLTEIAARSVLGREQEAALAAQAARSPDEAPADKALPA